MATDRQALLALEEIDQILRSRITRRHGGSPAGQPENVAADYQQIRVQLDTALTLIDKIPVYGRKIGTAVRFLMQIGDRACLPDADSGRSADTAVSRHHGDADGVSDVLQLIQDGHTPWAQTRRRDPAAERRSPSADGAGGMIGVI